MTAILSLSLLTVMAGAAVAPALGTIREHFSDSPDTVVQLIISMPALFIFLTSFIFPSLCKKYGSRTLVMTGLALYVIGGCGAALFDNIWIVLIFMSLVTALLGGLGLTHLSFCFAAVLAVIMTIIAFFMRAAEK